MSVSRGALRDQGEGAARRALLLVPGVPVSRRRNRRGERRFPHRGRRRLRPADRLRDTGRQRRDHAPPLLFPMRHAGVQRGRTAADHDLRARGNARRSQSGGAHGDHLDQVRAGLGVLRPRPAEDRRAAPASQGVSEAALRGRTTTMLFMVIERFQDNDMVPVYRRLRESGRSLPEGLEYVASWVEANFSRCFQLMRCDDLTLLQAWILEWRGAGVTFEIAPVVTSAEARAAVEPYLDERRDV